MRCKIFVAAVLWAGLSMAFGTAQAGTIWDAGGGATTNIDLNTNWDGDVANALNGTTSATFGTAGATATINVNASFTGITFNRDANFAIANGAGSLTIGTGGITAAIPTTTARTYTVSENSLVLGGNQTWTTTNNTGLTSLTVSSVISDGVNDYKITKAGNGTLTLSSSSSTFSGGVELTAGTLVVAASSTNNPPTIGPLGTGTLTLAGGTLQLGTTTGVNTTIANPINVTGATAVTALGNGGFDSFIDGTLSGTASSSLTFSAPGGSARLNGNASNFFGTINWTNTNGQMSLRLLVNADNFSNATFNLSGNNANNRLLVLGTTAATVQMGALQGAAGRIGSGTKNLQVGALGTSTSYGGLLEMTGGAGFTKVGAGKLTLTAASTGTSYTGTTLVSAGTLEYGISNVILTGPVTVNGATAVLSLLGFSDSVGIVTLENGGQITSGAGILTSTGTFEMKSGSASARLAGAVPLNKTTAGTVTLSGVNTYSGTTTISGGLLLANTAVSGTNSATGTGGVSVSATGTLGGAGQITPTGTNSISVASGGLIAPGASIGTLTFNLGSTTGDIAMLSGSDFQFELGVPNGSIGSIAPGSSDLLVILNAAAGDMDFTGNDIDLLGTASGTGFYKLFDTSFNSTTWTGLTTGGSTTGGNLIIGGLTVSNFGGSFSGDLILADGTAGTSAGDIYLSVQDAAAVVPEPGSIVLAAVGLMGLGLLVWRRRL